MSAAQNFLASWDSLPTTLPSAYTPLSKKPTPGMTIIKVVNGKIPSDNDSYEQLVIAANSIGWTAKKIVDDGTVEDLNQKFEQAISDKPAVITVSGFPAASIQQPLADAAKAGILVALSAVADVPTSDPGFAVGPNGGATSKEIGELNAYEFLRASNCNGNAAIFSLAGYPILTLATDEFTSVIKAHCSACDVSYNEVQATDIGTPAVTNAIVSKLQSSPKTKYVYTIIGNVADGLATALSQANINGVQIFGQVPDDNSIAALRNGTNAWWVDQSSLIDGWTTLDAVLRAIDTGKIVVDNGHYPLAVLTPKNVPSGTSQPVYPLDYQTEFEKLWLVH